MPLIPTYLLIINASTFAAFGLDKALARAKSGRISEANLLTLALIGGTPGAYAARALFHHKSRKKSFSNNLFWIAMLHALALGGGMAWKLG